MIEEACHDEDVVIEACHKMMKKQSLKHVMMKMMQSLKRVMS